MLGRSGCACSSSLLAMFRQEFELSLLPGQQFCKQNGLSILSKKQNGQRMSFEFLDCMALATSC